MSIQYADCTFEGAQIILDEGSYTRCVFRRCEIIYRGGTFNLVDCDFDQPTFHFQGAAAYTVEFLKAMCTIPGGAAYFDAVFPGRMRVPGAPLH